MVSLISNPQACVNYSNLYSDMGKDDGVIHEAIKILTHPDDNIPSNTHLALRKIFSYAKTRLKWYNIIVWKLLGRGQQLEDLKNLKSKLSPCKRMDAALYRSDIQNAAQALVHFQLNFKTTFNKTPKPMNGNETKLITEISTRIWASNYVNAQQTQAEKYHQYHRLMRKYYKGAHYIIKLKEDESLVQGLKDKIGYVDSKKDLGRAQLAPRVSSHYVASVGEEDHIHLAGNQIPETVFGEVLIPVRGEQIIFGTSHKMHLQKYKNENPPSVGTKYFWIQTENNPDGPDWPSFLKHRIIDFVIYTFRKMLGKEKCNVGPYGYGCGDRNPIILS